MKKMSLFALIAFSSACAFAGTGDTGSASLNDDRSVLHENQVSMTMTDTRIRVYKAIMECAAKATNVPQEQRFQRINIDRTTGTYFGNYPSLYIRDCVPALKRQGLKAPLFNNRTWMNENFSAQSLSQFINKIAVDISLEQSANETDRVINAIAHQFYRDPSEIEFNTYAEDVVRMPSNQLAVEIAQGYEILGYGKLNPRRLYTEIESLCYATVENRKRVSRATMECLGQAVTATKK